MTDHRSDGELYVRTPANNNNDDIRVYADGHSNLCPQDIQAGYHRRIFHSTIPSCEPSVRETQSVDPRVRQSFTVNPLEDKIRRNEDVNNLVGFNVTNRSNAPPNLCQTNAEWSNRNDPFNHSINCSRMKPVPVHSWKISFSGEAQRMSETDLGVNDFIFQVTVQKNAQSLSDNDVLSQIVFLLTHSARTWYYACHESFYNWEAFVEAMRRTFLSVHHKVDALLEIANRVQRPSESARTYLYHMLMMFQSLPHRIDENIQVRIILGNMSSNIIAKVGPWDPKTIAELDRILASIEPRRFEHRPFDSRDPTF